MDGPEFEQRDRGEIPGQAPRGDAEIFSCAVTAGSRTVKGVRVQLQGQDHHRAALFERGLEAPRTGKLRLLRNGTDLDDYAAEVPPDDGTLLVFRRSENSWHGHGPFEGVRRSIQMNWMVSEGRRGFHALRHKISARFKKAGDGVVKGEKGRCASLRGQSMPPRRRKPGREPHGGPREGESSQKPRSAKGRSLRHRRRRRPRTEHRRST